MTTAFTPDEYTVLVVDGDCEVCAQLTALLHKAGYRARAFQSGEEMLGEIDELPGRVCLITEMNLPGMSGLELISRLRQANISAPAVILTHLSDVATAVRAMRDRVSDYLIKPYVERDLINRLQSALQRQYAPG
ncbi:MAG: response regulator [Gammaproteobacteria bacterium]|jgi:FixJ family two-component response regulator|nr:response regulator [Gammaproteobacteria bacterium]